MSVPSAAPSDDSVRHAPSADLFAEIEEALRRERRSILGDVDDAPLEDEDSADDPGALLAARGERSALAQQTSEQLVSIDRALERLEAGDYGTCASCDETIPEERLEALPTAVLCVSCQEQGAA
jgi:DnaK suppressor protein